MRTGAMLSDDSFPLYAFEKDDWSMFLVESPDKVLSHIEPIDFENDEYLFWDAQGHGVRLTLERGTLTSIEDAENEITIQEAFARYSQSLGVTVDTTRPFPEVWARLQANVKPPSRFDRTVGHVLGSGCFLVVLIAVFILILLGGVIKALFVRQYSPVVGDKPVYAQNLNERYGLLTSLENETACEPRYAVDCSAVGPFGS
jgi:hypothetical protein